MKNRTVPRGVERKRVRVAGVYLSIVPCRLSVVAGWVSPGAEGTCTQASEATTAASTKTLMFLDGSFKRRAG